MSWLSKLLGEPVDAPAGPTGSVAVHPHPAVRPDRAAGPLTSARLRTEVAALPRTKFREGYALADVDAFVDRVARALEEQGRGHRPSVSGDEVRDVRFKATKFAEGYDQDAVDDLLDRVRATLG